MIITSEKIHYKIPLDYNKIKELKKAAKKGLGWDDVIGELWDASNELIRTEIANRGKNRAKILKMKEKEKIYDKKEKLHHKMSMGHLKKTIELIDESVKSFDNKKIQELEKIKENVAPLRTEALDYIKESLLESDIEPEIAGEIVDSYEEVVKIVETDGFNGLVNNIKKNLNELIEIRSDESKNRGRDKKHSPLAWWKWIFIIGVAGVGIGTLIPCLIWLGCVWIFKIAMGCSSVVIAICATGC